MEYARKDRVSKLKSRNSRVSKVIGQEN